MTAPVFAAYDLPLKTDVIAYPQPEIAEFGAVGLAAVLIVEKGIIKLVYYVSELLFRCFMKTPPVDIFLFDDLFDLIAYPISFGLAFQLLAPLCIVPIF